MNKKHRSFVCIIFSLLCIMAATFFTFPARVAGEEKISDKGIKQFIEDYENVSNHTLTDYEEIFSDEVSVYDNKCRLDIENNNTEDEGNFEVTINFDDAEDDAIVEIFSNCLTVFGVTEEDIEELTDNFDSNDFSSYDIDDSLLEEHYGDNLSVEFTKTVATPSDRNRPHYGNIDIICKNYRPDMDADALMEQDRITNPTTEVTKEEMVEETSIDIDAPDGSKNVRYSIIETEDLDSMAQVDFEYEGHAYYFRAKETELTELTGTDTCNISGLYYKFNKSEDSRVGVCEAQVFIAKEAGYITWINFQAGTLCNLCSADPVDSKTLAAVANACKISEN